MSTFSETQLSFPLRRVVIRELNPRVMEPQGAWCCFGCAGSSHVTLLHLGQCCRGMYVEAAPWAKGLCLEAAAPITPQGLHMALEHGQWLQHHWPLFLSPRSSLKGGGLRGPVCKLRAGDPRKAPSEISRGGRWVSLRVSAASCQLTQAGVLGHTLHRQRARQTEGASGWQSFVPTQCRVSG